MKKKHLEIKNFENREMISKKKRRKVGFARRQLRMKNVFFSDKNITDFNCTITSAKKMYATIKKAKIKTCTYLVWEESLAIAK